MTNVAVFSHNNTFLEPLLKELSKKDDTVLKLFLFDKNETKSYDEKAVADALDWCDVAFFEWANVSKNTLLTKDFDCRTVVRIHRYELYRKHLMYFDWTKIDNLIFGSGECKDFFNSNINPKPKKLTVIPTNWVNQDIFEIFALKDKTEFLNILMVGHLADRKGQYMALNYLKDINVPCVLTICSNSKDAEYAYDCDKYITKNNLPAGFVSDCSDEELVGFYNRSDVILSMSRNEGNQMSIAEGLMCGCFPVVNAWRGADGVYGSDCVFSGFVEFEQKLREIYNMKNNHTVESWNKLRIGNRNRCIADFNEVDLVEETIMEVLNECR